MKTIPKVIDPKKMLRLLWPTVTMYKQQWDMIYSVCDNIETFAPAGNMLGV